MFRNYIKTAFRNLRRNRLYAAINIFGLMVGLTACLLLGIFIQHELSYDKFNKKADRIVRATMEYKMAGTVNKVATTGSKVGPQFKRTFPAIEAYCRTYIDDGVIKSGNNVFEERRILYADESFFNIFSFDLLEGNVATALDAPDKIVITKSMARKYFGGSSQDILNQTLTMGDRVFSVSAVCEDVPQNSQIKFDFVVPFTNLGNNATNEIWWTANWITYFVLKDKAQLPELQKQITAYMNTPEVRREAGLEGNNYLNYHLEPLTKVHLYSALPGFEPNGSIEYIYMLGLIALFILIIACANYTNLATAQSAGRTGEIGMRKVMGASKRQVFIQFISESIVITFLAAALAFLVSLFLIPYFNYVTGKHFTSSVLLQPWPIISLILFTLLVSFIATLYPAIVLSGTQVMSVLKKGFNFTGGKNMLRKTLIVAQFAISIFLITYTVIILQQMHFMQIKNLGYDKNHVVVLPIGGDMKKNFTTLKSAFSQVLGVQAVTASYETPEDVGWGDGITAIDENGKHVISLNAMPVALDFTETMKMEIVAGRDFQESDYAMMDTSDSHANYHQPFIINETLAKEIGWTPQEAIGKTIQRGATGPVVGVVKDFNFTSLHNPIGPVLLFLGRDYSRNFLIRINGNNIQSTLAGIASVWKERIPGRPFSYHFLDEDYNRLYASEQKMTLLLGVAAGFAMVLACLGLFGLAAFTTVQRTKEIGIRRVLGANVSNITFMIAKNFLVLVGIAILIGIPLAWWAGNRWLQDFAFRIEVHSYIFIIAALATAFIALCTVGYHSVRAALSNPVESLRSE